MIVVPHHLKVRETYDLLTREVLGSSLLLQSATLRQTKQQSRVREASQSSNFFLRIEIGSYTDRPL